MFDVRWGRWGDGAMAMTMAMVTAIVGGRAALTNTITTTLLPTLTTRLPAMLTNLDMTGRSVLPLRIISRPLWAFMGPHGKRSVIGD